ncbi:MAG TPA: DUF2130 domain-containing protein, partial [Bacteroidia bacterium]|nr:DUF2130 domain-containing protein [Bacteroidia bacterium]
EFTERLERMRSDIRKQTQQESNLTIKTKDKLITDLKEQITKIRQKLDNSSQQMVGEIQELELETILASTFPTDKVCPVPKGINGADCQLDICSSSGDKFGSVLFESKRVQNFSEKWIDKLREDNLRAKCDAMVLVVSVMPKGVTEKIIVKDGLYIIQFDEQTIKQTVLILRYGIIKACQIIQAHSYGDTDANKIFEYLTSNEFKNQFERILKGYKELEDSFQKERKQFTALMKIKEQHLQEMLTNTLEFYGNIKGIAGAAIPELPTLSYRKAG